MPADSDTISQLQEPADTMIEPLLTPRVGYTATKVTREVTGFPTPPTPSQSVFT